MYSYKRRKLNPLGIRKLDVQAERRQARKDAKGHTEHLADSRYFNYDDRQDIKRALVIAYERGWEHGVRVGAKATRDRVKESLDNGTLQLTESQ